MKMEDKGLLFTLLGEYKFTLIKSLDKYSSHTLSINGEIQTKIDMIEYATQIIQDQPLTNE